MDLASGKPRAGSFLSPHSLTCRRRMEDAIKVTDPARWGRWLLRRGQEEIDREGIAQPSGDTGAPSGPDDPVAAVNAHSEREAPKEVSERNPGCLEESACAEEPRCDCVASPLTAGPLSAGGGLMELLCKVDMCEVFSPSQGRTRSCEVWAGGGRRYGSHHRLGFYKSGRSTTRREIRRRE